MRRYCMVRMNLRSQNLLYIVRNPIILSIVGLVWHMASNMEKTVRIKHINTVLLALYTNHTYTYTNIGSPSEKYIYIYIYIYIYNIYIYIIYNIVVSSCWQGLVYTMYSLRRGDLHQRSDHPKGMS